MTILGIVFHHSMKWKAHVHHIVKKAAQRIHVLKTIRRISGVTKNDLILVYKQITRSNLEYNSPLFVGILKSDSMLLDRIQNRCHRVICGGACPSGCLVPLKLRREHQSITLFKNIFDTTHPLHYLAPKTLKHTRKISVPFSRTLLRQNSFVPFCINLLNDS